MKRGVGILIAWLLPVLVASVTTGSAVARAQGCVVDVVPISVPVEGEIATGLAYEPRGCAGGDALIVAAHGHKGSAAQYGDYLTSIVRRTGAPIVSMDLRGSAQWRTGEWNLWAGWQDLVAATHWYKGSHPGIARTIVWGWSQGGMTSGLAAAYAPPGTFDYWVDAYGPSDLFSYWQSRAVSNGELSAQIQRDAGGCPPITCPLAYAERSPALQAPRIGVRHSVIVHGTADEVVPYSSSTQMRTALMLSGKSSSFYSIASGRTLDGRVEPGRHNVGPVLFEAGCVVERLVHGTEPLDGNRDYLVDVAAGIVNAPPAPPAAKCAA